MLNKIKGIDVLNISQDIKYDFKARFPHLM